MALKLLVTVMLTKSQVFDPVRGTLRCEGV